MRRLIRNVGFTLTKPGDAMHIVNTQSDVDHSFVMLVPVFADFGKGMVRIGQVSVAGSSTHNADAILPIQPKKVALNAYKDVLDR